MVFPWCLEKEVIRMSTRSRQGEHVLCLLVDAGYQMTPAEASGKHTHELKYVKLCWPVSHAIGLASRVTLSQGEQHYRKDK